MSPSSATNEYGYCSVCGHLNNDISVCNCANKQLLKLRPVPTRKLTIEEVVEHIDNLPLTGPKYDTGKLRYDLVTPDVIKAIAEVLTFGAEKYAPNSWQLVPDAKRRYTAALMRHFEAYRAGEQLDQESGLSHLSHALCNLMFLQHFENKPQGN